MKRFAALLLAGIACSTVELAGDERSLRYLSGARYGSADGPGPEALFAGPAGLVVDGGSLYVADLFNGAVRRIDLTTREVTTVAGGGTADHGSGADVLASASALAADGAGSLYLAFDGTRTTFFGVMKLDLASAVMAPLAGGGSVGTWGPGWGQGAVFARPVGVAWEGGALYVLSGNGVRKVEVPLGRTTAIAGIEDLAGAHRDGPAELARFSSPKGIVGDGRGNLFIADGSHVVRKLDLASRLVSTIAGSPFLAGDQDGVGAAARFRSLTAIAIDPSGNLFVTEQSSLVVRRIEVGTHRVTTVAGARGRDGNRDGRGASARFSQPISLACDAAGNVYVGDTGSRSVRRIDPSGLVSTVAGPESHVLSERSPGGSPSSLRQVVSEGELMGLMGLAADSRGVFVLDSKAHAVRHVLPDGQIASIAGGGDPGIADGVGPAATFRSESTLRSDGAFLYAQQEGRIRRISPATGEVTTLPFAAGDPFVLHQGSVLWRDQAGVVTRTDLATGAASVLPLAPTGIRHFATGPDGELFASTHSPVVGILRLDPQTGAHTVLAGGPTGGSADGIGTDARFSNLGELCFDGDRSLYVIELVVSKIRRVDIVTGQVTTLDLPGGAHRITTDGLGRIWVARGEAVFEILPRLPDRAVAHSASGALGEPHEIHAEPRTAEDLAFRLVRKPARSSASLVETAEGALLTPDVADRFDVELVARSEAAGSAHATSVVSVSPVQSRCVPFAVHASPPTAGTATFAVPPECPMGQVSAGARVSISATPSPGFVFAGWAARAGNRFAVSYPMVPTTRVVVAAAVELEARFIEESRCHKVSFVRTASFDPGNCWLPGGGFGYVASSPVRVAAFNASGTPSGPFAYWRVSGGAHVARNGEPVIDVVIEGPATVEAVYAPSPPAQDAARRFYTLRPCRLVDSREGSAASLGGERRAFVLGGACGIPAAATALSVNLTALDATGTGELKAYAAGSASSPPAVIPVRPGPARAVGAFVRLSLDSGRAVIVETASGTGTAHFILDVNGYWQ